MAKYEHIAHYYVCTAPLNSALSCYYTVSWMNTTQYNYVSCYSLIDQIVVAIVLLSVYKHSLNY